jgi:uncharacterized membrane protein YhaH (DUF805 family)
MATNRKYVFLSFRGRLSAEPFKSAAAALDRICYIPVSFSLLWRPDPTPKVYWLIIHGTLLALYLAAIWPWLAVTIKRLHDSEGPVLLAFATALSLPLAMTVLLTHDPRLGRPISYPAIGVVLLLFTAQVLLVRVIARRPSVPGPNRFGPQPID